MKIYQQPAIADWKWLCERPYFSSEQLEEKVKGILTEVKQRGDAAIRELNLKFDQVESGQLKVPQSEVMAASGYVSEQLKNAISIAAGNIRKFHAVQQRREKPLETMPGLTCWRQSVAIETVGLYIPGGSAPLFSTILMLAIPATLAGCNRIILCSPAGKNGEINPIILYTASFLGIQEIFKVGGAQAIAAMAYGTATIPRVDKIFGPGNQYVTKAKELVQRQGIAIDLPAGPSEVLVIADENADADFVAADLLSQAEHGPDSQVVFLTNSPKMLKNVLAAISVQLQKLPRAAIAEKALKNSFVVFFESIDECISFSNSYAPEHLILAIADARTYANRIINAGSVFMGNYSCESAGDYASGTNHTLPTNGFARSYSGVSVDSFLKKISFQEITKQGLLNVGPTIEIMAEAEQLTAHKNAVSLRLKKINNEL